MKQSEQNKIIRKWMRTHGMAVMNKYGSFSLIVPSMMGDKETPEWKPEKGSKEHVPVGVDHGINGRELKKHWSGAFNCNAVVGKWAFVHKQRFLPGDEFDMAPAKERCKTCDQAFSES